MHSVKVEGADVNCGRPPVRHGDVIKIRDPGSSNLNRNNVVFVVEPRRGLFERNCGSVYVFDPELFVVFELCGNARYEVIKPERVVIEINEEGI